MLLARVGHSPSLMYSAWWRSYGWGAFCGSVSCAAVANRCRRCIRIAADRVYEV